MMKQPCAYKPDCKRLSGGSSVQDIPHRPVLGITLQPFVHPESPQVDLPQTLADLVCASLEERSTPFVVAISGWADTGKSTVAARLCGALARLGITGESISTDDFMKDRAERNALEISGYDLRSLDGAALQGAVTRFLNRETFTVHPYDNRTGTKSPTPKTVFPGQVLVVEGIHSLHPNLSPHTDLKVFVTSDEATLREMRFRANRQKRGMTAAGAAARISSEWLDYSATLRPRLEVAEVVVHVDLDYRYRWFKEAS